jgi:DMSO/TMAO reductase YedYZ heme-binding membrane subunit
MFNVIVNNKKALYIIIGIIAFILVLPLITTTINIIFSLGQYTGTGIRTLIENKIC